MPVALGPRGGCWPRSGAGMKRAVRRVLQSTPQPSLADDGAAPVGRLLRDP